MTPAFRNVLLWIVGALILVIMALMPLQGAYLNGEYLPAHPDAFYHARRILDVVMTGQPIMQFDSKIHVPEGSWITWPWAFDSAMAWITSWFGPFANEAQANRVLMHVPVAMGAVFVGIVLLVAVQLELSFTLRALLVIGMSALPVVNWSFAVGNIDHHFAETLWTALTLAAGLGFVRRPDSLAPGICLGLVLATAIGVHNSMFILQVPVALFFALRWLRGDVLPPFRSALAFALSLALGTLLVCIPSQPWRQGFFEFYTLSWFHLYIAAATALFCVLLTRVARTTRSVVILGLAAMLVLVPIVGMLGLAGSFMSGQLETLRFIAEVQSPYQLYANAGSAISTAQYSWLMWLSVPALVFNAFIAWRAREPGVQFFAVLGVLGLTLLQLQFRFHVFGELALVATPLLAIHFAQRHWPQLSGRLALLACIGMLVAYVPTTAAWSLKKITAGQPGYKEFSGVFPVMREACAKRPGIVLASIDAGHWVRYHTACSVIADVFLLTPQHAAKDRENRMLMTKTPAHLLEAPQPVRYVFAFHALALIPRTGEPPLDDFRSRMDLLESSLLGDLRDLPPQYHLLWEQRTPAGQIYARLFEIVR
jgi:asparagine N-glycosylation enzyme membrane subunit Stt3